MEDCINAEIRNSDTVLTSARCCMFMNLSLCLASQSERNEESIVWKWEQGTGRSHWVWRGVFPGGRRIHALGVLCRCGWVLSWAPDQSPLPSLLWSSAGSMFFVIFFFSILFVLISKGFFSVDKLLFRAGKYFKLWDNKHFCKPQSNLRPSPEKIVCLVLFFIVQVFACLP